MPNVKNRIFDEVSRYIRRTLRFEICVVDKVRWHKMPFSADKDFNVVDVVMRDRANISDPHKDYIRFRAVCLNGLVGRFFGKPWTPRRGDVVKVWFYHKRKGVILGTIPSYGNEPVCRPNPYVIREKICQYRPHYQNENYDFPDKSHPYPDGKKPTCYNWFHGPCFGDARDDKKEPTIGRDWVKVWDYCQQGDEDPTCKDCDTIDYPKRKKNQWLKVYSWESESCEAPDKRWEWHWFCGTHLRIENETNLKRSIEYTEGKSHIRWANAVHEKDRRWHLNVQGEQLPGIDSAPNINRVGTFDLHTNHQNPPYGLSNTEVPLKFETEGVRFAATRPEDDQVTWAYEFMKFPSPYTADSHSFIRCYKNGVIEINSCDGNSTIVVDGVLKKVTIDGIEDVLVKATDDIVLQAGDQITLQATNKILAQTALFEHTGLVTAPDCHHAACTCPCCVVDGWTTYGV